MASDINQQIPEAVQITNQKPEEIMPRHAVVSAVKTKNKKTILKAAIRKHFTEEKNEW